MALTLSSICWWKLSTLFLVFDLPILQYNKSTGWNSMVKSEAWSPFGFLTTWGSSGETWMGCKNPFRVENFIVGDNQASNSFGAYAMWYALGNSCILNDSQWPLRIYMGYHASSCMLTISYHFLHHSKFLRIYTVKWRLVATASFSFFRFFLRLYIYI